MDTTTLLTGVASAAVTTAAAEPSKSTLGARVSAAIFGRPSDAAPAFATLKEEPRARAGSDVGFVVNPLGTLVTAGRVPNNEESPGAPLLV